MWIPSVGDSSRAPAQAPPALPLTLMGTSSSEQPQGRHEVSPQHPGPQGNTSTPTGANWGPEGTLLHQPDLHRVCWGAAPGLCRQTSSLSSSWGTQPILQLLGKELPSRRARHSLSGFPGINILPAPVSPLWLPQLLDAHQAQPWLGLCSPSLSLSTHSPDRWRCPSLAGLDKSQGNAGKTPPPSHYLSSVTLDSEKPLT